MKSRKACCVGETVGKTFYHDSECKTRKAKKCEQCEDILSAENPSLVYDPTVVGYLCDKHFEESKYNQEDKPQHTTTPWKVIVCQDGLNIVTEVNRFVAKVTDSTGTQSNLDATNAAFIVRAVNSHEDMLNALKKVEKYAFKASGDELLQWVQEAIAKAEGL